MVSLSEGMMWLPQIAPEDRGGLERGGGPAKNVGAQPVQMPAGWERRVRSLTQFGGVTWSRVRTHRGVPGRAQ